MYKHKTTQKTVANRGCPSHLW